VLVKKDPDVIKSYFEDVSNLKGGHASEVIFPETPGELSAVLKEADSKKTSVTISGGGTGTAGSRIPFGGIVVSMEKLNKIHDISVSGMTASLQAGVTVDDLKDACEKKGLFYTSHPTERSAFVGGTISTNASGARSFKYGPTRKYIKRLKMALPSGELLDVRRGEHSITGRDSLIRLDSGREIKIPLPSYKMPDTKNSAGYFAKDGMDLIDLFIGQEGTLSVITDIELGLVRKPEGIFSCFVFFKKEEDSWGFAGDLRRISRAGPEEGALSIEYFSDNALRLLRLKSANLPAGAKAAIFFEQEIREGDEMTVAGKWLEVISRRGATSDDTWVAMTEKDAERFTELRYMMPESVNEIVKRLGFQKLSTDIAVPENRFLELMRFYKGAFDEGGIDNIMFGHIGECHVHTNLLPKSEAECGRAREIVLALIKKGVSLGGSISAEHGIGKTKHKYLEVMYGREGVLEMARVKKAFDPNCILNLDNIFPRELLKAV
jgi:D-lactate dehydrogenase (cytochrome)